MRTAAQTFALMAILTLLSKVLGFVREMVMANFYGTSYIVDAYVMATAIPSIIFGGIFGAVATAYMPTYSLMKEKEAEGEGDKFTSQVINLLVVFSIIAAMTGALFSDQIVYIFANGFDEETASLTSFFVKITFSYVIFTSTSNIFDSYLQYRGIFLKPIIAGYFHNFGTIAVILLSAYTGHYILAVGVLIGSGGRLAYLYYVAGKEGYRHSRSLSFGKTVRHIIGLAIPVFIGTYILQINSFVDKSLASRLPEGSVSSLNYAMILITLITGLTVSLMVTLIYPRITRARTNEDWDYFNDVIEKGMNVILIIVVPFCLGILAFGEEVVQIVYERGAFDANATGMTAGAFFYYGIGLVFFALNDLFAKIFYSMQNTRSPIICAAVSVIINIVLNFLLVGPMAHMGLALATSIAAFVNTALLLIVLKKQYPHTVIFKSKKKSIEIVISSVIAVGIAYITYSLLLTNISMPMMINLGISVTSAVVVYLLMLILFKIEELKLISSLI